MRGGLPCLYGWCRSQFSGAQALAIGLIADLRVLLDVCQLIAAAAVPLVQLILWPEFAFASKRDERDEQTRISSTVQGGGKRRLERATALIWRNAWPAAFELGIFVAMSETLTLVCG